MFVPFEAYFLEGRVGKGILSPTSPRGGQRLHFWELETPQDTQNDWCIFLSVFLRDFPLGGGPIRAVVFEMSLHFYGLTFELETFLTQTHMYSMPSPPPGGHIPHNG